MGTSRLSPVQCTLTPAMTAELRSVGNVLDAPFPARLRWLQALEGSCRPWPAYLRSALSTARSKVDDAQKFTLSRDKPIWFWDDFRADAERWCPGFGRVRDAPPPRGEKNPQYGMMQRLWVHCGMAKAGLLTWEELVQTVVFAFVVGVVHERLRAGGIEPGVARHLARLFVFDQPLFDDARRRGITLPAGRWASELPYGAAEVSIERDWINVDGGPATSLKQGAVPAFDRSGTEPGAWISSLHGVLKERARRYQASAQQERRTWIGAVRLTADARTRLGFLQGVLATALGAEHRRLEVVYRTADRRPGLVLVQLVQPPRGAVSPGASPRIEVTSTGYTFRPTSTGARKHFARAASASASGPGTAVDRLVAHLKALRSARGALPVTSPAFGRIHLTLSSDLSLQDLVTLADALRELPRSGGTPGSDARCTFAWDRKTEDWIWAKRRRSDCLYPHVVLEL